MKSIKDYALFGIFLVTGLIIISFTISTVFGFSSTNGKELFAFYIPLPFSISYFLVSTWNGNLDRRKVLLTFLLFLSLLLPFRNFLIQPYQHLPQNDGYRYSLAAKNIAEQKTLWGSDDLSFGGNAKVYIMQPGYRYFLAAWILLWGDEIRLYQVLSMLIYLSSVLLLISSISKCSLPDLYKKGAWLFLIFSSPFVVKLILLGLSEWLAIVLFFLFIYSFLSGWFSFSIVTLAFLPFIRQNLLLFSLLLFALMMLRSSQKRKLTIIYFLILLLPLYHNLYYAGEWRFFSTYNNANWISVYDFEGSMIIKMIKIFFYHLSLYSGIDLLSPDVKRNLLSIAFIPVGTFIYMKCIFYLKGKERMLYLLLTLSVILPTLIFGWAYYPRFEWVNLMIGLVVFPCMNKLSRSDE